MTTFEDRTAQQNAARTASSPLWRIGKKKFTVNRAFSQRTPGAAGTSTTGLAAQPQCASPASSPPIRGATRSTTRRAPRASRFLAILAVLSIAKAWATDYPTLVQATPNLVGYWRFEPATLANSSVNAYTGTFLGGAGIGSTGSGPPFADVTGNSALILDGSGDAVTTSLSSQVQFPTAATIIAWVYLNQQPDFLSGQTFQIAARAMNANDLDFQLNPDHTLHFFTDSGGSAASPEGLPLHQWVMVAGTFDTVAGIRKVYIDGRAVGSNTPGPHSADSSAFTIGYNAVWPNRWFNGAIDEVAIFDRALSDQEIRDLQDASGDLIFRSNFTY